MGLACLFPSSVLFKCAVQSVLIRENARLGRSRGGCRLASLVALSGNVLAISVGGITMSTQVSKEVAERIEAMTKFAALTTDIPSITAVANLAGEITGGCANIDAVVDAFVSVHEKTPIFAVVEDCKNGIVFMLGLAGVHRKALTTVKLQKAYDYRLGECWRELAERIGLKEKTPVKPFDLQKLVDGFKAKIDAAIEAHEIDELEALTALQLVIADYLATEETETTEAETTED